jgi:hypothetical protein
MTTVPQDDYDDDEPLEDDGFDHSLFALEDAIASHYARQLGEDQPRPAVNEDPDWAKKWGAYLRKRAGLPPPER